LCAGTSSRTNASSSNDALGVTRPGQQTSANTAGNRGAAGRIQSGSSRAAVSGKEAAVEGIVPASGDNNSRNNTVSKQQEKNNSGSGRGEKRKKKKKSNSAKKKKKKSNRVKSRKDSSSSSSSSTSSCSSSDSGSTSDSNSSSRESSSGSSSDTSVEAGKRDKSKQEAGSGRKKKKKRGTMWQKLKEAWPKDKRPAELLDKDYVNSSWTFDELMSYKKEWVGQVEARGDGEAVFGKDSKPRAVKYAKKKDDGVTKLHEARWARLPLSEPEAYWKKVPKKREHVYRHISLAHYGAEGLIPEAAIVKMHDRQVPIELKMLHSANFGKVLKGKEKSDWAEPSEIRHLQEAVTNYATIMQVLWPFDFGPLVIQRVLVECKWGDAAGDNDKLRTQLVSR